MDATPLDRSRNDDPRKLRAMLEKAAVLAAEHSLGSVVVGLATDEGDRIFPEVVDFVESALRVDDSIFRMTRERAVLLLSDADRAGAEEILGRLFSDFRARFPAAHEPEVAVGFYEVNPGVRNVTVKEILPAVFNVACEAS